MTFLDNVSAVGADFPFMSTPLVSPNANMWNPSHLPPSPSSSVNSVDQKDFVLAPQTHSPVSPPHSPSSTSASPKPDQITTAIVTVPSLSHLKIPIPKATKPKSLMKVVGGTHQSLVLTSSQLEQLKNSGVLKVTSQSANNICVNNASNSGVAAPVVVKTEPGQPNFSPAVHPMPMTPASSCADFDVRQQWYHSTCQWLKISLLASDYR